MPFWFGVAAGVGGPAARYGATAFVAPGLRRGIGSILAGCFAWDVGVIVRLQVAAGVGSLVRALRLLVNEDVNPVEFIIGVSLPWLMGLVSAVRRRHSVTLAVWDVAISLHNVVPVGLKRMSDNVLVGVVIKDWSSRQSWDFHIIAHARE